MFSSQLHQRRISTILPTRIDLHYQQQGLTCAFLGCNAALAQRTVTSDIPMQRELMPNIDRVVGAHERRARLIAHEQAIATANDLSAQQKAIGAGIA
jgi:hypothetical protein